MRENEGEGERCLLINHVDDHHLKWIALWHLFAYEGVYIDAYASLCMFMMFKSERRRNFVGLYHLPYFFLVLQYYSDECAFPPNLIDWFDLIICCCLLSLFISFRFNFFLVSLISFEILLCCVCVHEFVVGLFVTLRCDIKVFLFCIF